MPSSLPLDTIAVTFEASDYTLDLVRKHFPTVHFYPNNDIPAEKAKEVDIWFTRWFGLPAHITIEDLGKTKAVQLLSAGADLAMKHPAMQTEAGKRISVCTSSGIHSLSMPGYIIGQIQGIYMNIHTAVMIMRTEARWPEKEELRYRDTPMNAPGNMHVGLQVLRGKTAGLLGYGAIARETARLLQAFGVHVVAANSTGTKRADTGYIIPGTGDPDGSIPEQYYSTADAASFKQFLGRSDILIASMPSTPATRYMLTQEHFDALPEDAIFINVGRGDLVKSETLLQALNAPHGLLAVGLDVTDPEPLPKGHALFTHPRAVITPHCSADFAGYFDAGADLLIANVKRVREGGELMNVVDREKGY